MILGLGQSVASVGDSISNSMECRSCIIRHEHLRMIMEMHALEISRNRKDLEYERTRSEELQKRLDIILRLSKPEITNKEPVPVQAPISPMRQRHTAEAESRAKYWKEQVKKVEERDKTELGRTTEES